MEFPDSPHGLAVLIHLLKFLAVLSDFEKTGELVADLVARLDPCDYTALKGPYIGITEFDELLGHIALSLMGSAEYHNFGILVLYKGRNRIEMACVNMVSVGYVEGIEFRMGPGVYQIGLFFACDDIVIKFLKLLEIKLSYFRNCRTGLLPNLLFFLLQRA